MERRMSPPERSRALGIDSARHCRRLPRLTSSEYRRFFPMWRGALLRLGRPVRRPAGRGWLRCERRHRLGARSRRAVGEAPDRVTVVYEYAGIGYRAEHISALILRKVMRDAQLLVGPVTEAVITVPAYFNDSMRLATRRAGELAESKCWDCWPSRQRRPSRSGTTVGQKVPSAWWSTSAGAPST